ncbi:FUSC family protein, partial [Xanthomonas perforans]
TLPNPAPPLPAPPAPFPRVPPPPAALADTIDRVTDSIGTLTHLLRPARPASADAPAVHDGVHDAGR